MVTTLHSQKYLLMVGGLLPSNSRKYFPHASPVLITVLNNIWPAFCFLNLIHILMFGFYAIFFCSGFPFEERMAQYQDIFGLLNLFFYHVVFILMRKKIQRAIGLLERDLPPQSLSGIVFIKMEDCVDKCRKLTNIVAPVFVGATIFHGLQPLFRGLAYKSHSFHGQYPFEWAYKSPGYEILYSIQMLGQMNQGCQFGGIILLFVSVARIMIVQFEMLLCSIKNIVNGAFMRRGDGRSQALLRRALYKWRNEVKVSNDYFLGVEQEEGDWAEESLSFAFHAVSEDGFECGEYDQEVLIGIAKCTERQVLITKVSKALEEFLCFNMLSTLGCLIISTCVLIFALTSIGKVNETTLDFANYLMAGYFSWLLLSYYPHIMSYQSGMINAAYNEIPWHLFSPKVRKHLVIILMNSQEPFYFTCGSFTNIDLRLFIMAVKTSFSFFTLLSSMLE